MAKQVEVKRIVIRIGDKEAQLTPNEAKALRDVLDEMFGEKVKEIHHYDHYRDWWVIPYQPWTVTYTNTLANNKVDAVYTISAGSNCASLMQ